MSYSEYYSTVTEWGQYPRFRLHLMKSKPKTLNSTLHRTSAKVTHQNSDAICLTLHALNRDPLLLMHFFWVLVT